MNYFIEDLNLICFNSLASAVIQKALIVLGLLSKNTELRDKLADNTQYFNKKMMQAGFDIVKGDSAIISFI